MPAIRNTTPAANNSSSSPPGSTTKAAPGWSKKQKSALFSHVLKYGEKDWKVAVPGKTGKECSTQWKLYCRTSWGPRGFERDKCGDCERRIPRR